MAARSAGVRELGGMAPGTALLPPKLLPPKLLPPKRLPLEAPWPGELAACISSAQRRSGGSGGGGGGIEGTSA